MCFDDFKKIKKIPDNVNDMTFMVTCYWDSYEVTRWDPQCQQRVYGQKSELFPGTHVYCVLYSMCLNCFVYFWLLQAASQVGSISAPKLHETEELKSFWKEPHCPECSQRRGCQLLWPSKMSRLSEDVLLVIKQVRHKKSEGTLYMMGERMAWMLESKNVFSVSHLYADIKGRSLSHAQQCVWMSVCFSW